MKRIAVVEDNPDNRMLVEALLSDRYAVELYESGPEALAAFRQSAPDLVLLDISLPGMSGSEVLSALRSESSQQFAELPVIALTAHAMSDDRDRFLGQGFDDYVTKPIVDEDILFLAIERLLARPGTAAV